MRFTQIADSLKYPPTIKGELSTIHAKIIDYTIANYRPTHKFRRNVIDVMNTVTLLYQAGDSLPVSWSADEPLSNIILADDMTCKLALGELFIKFKEVVWDIEIPDVNDTTTASIITSEKVESSQKDKQTKSTAGNQKVSIQRKKELVPEATSAYQRIKAKEHYPLVGKSKKEDLYIQGPVVPLFDSSKVKIRLNDGTSSFYMYESVPVVPTKQCEISCTTNVNSLLDNEVLRLFPDHFIPTRNKAMYEPIMNLSMHDRLGIIPKISGFTEAQIVDNIIRYPHIYQLKKETDKGLRPFYSSIEIDGQLYNITSVWREMLDTKDIPMITEYMKEYVIRRYLLERDIKHINHRYRLYGSLDPFLTLFTTPEEYANFGYKDSVQLARACVTSRVSYKQSRNPIIRRASMNA